MHLAVPSEIDSFIFDLGEVIVHLDEKQPLQGFSRYTNHSLEEIKKLLVSHPALYQFEVGALTDREFIETISQGLDMAIHTQEFEMIWNSLIVSIPLANLQLLETLSSTHKTFILSNTNTMHERRFESLVAKISGGRSMGEFVHHAYYSHHLGIRKPNQDAFQFIISEHDLVPERTVFFDDKIENVEAAISLGLHAILVTNYEILDDYFGLSPVSARR